MAVRAHARAGAILLRHEPVRAPTCAFLPCPGLRTVDSKKAHMKATASLIALTLGLMATSGVFAATPAAAASAPAGSTGLCKDGTYTTNATKKGACAGHKGVKTWMGGDAAAPAVAATPAAATTATAAPAATATAATATAAKPAKTATATTASAAPAAGGGPGMVWVNSSSKVYHCSGTKYYGKTKQGSYMTEDAAKAAGNHADHGKSCS